MVALRVAPLEAGGGGIRGNHVDVATGEEYWISGVKTRGSNRHRAGSGAILVEESVAEELLALLQVPELDRRLYAVIPDLPQTDPQEWSEYLNRKM